MVYVCNKVELLFQLCESCETPKKCERESKKSETKLDMIHAELITAEA